MRKYFALPALAVTLTTLAAAGAARADAGALDPLLGDWNCGSYTVHVKRTANIVRMEHVIDRRAKGPARYLIQLDDTDPDKIVAQGSLFDWTFAAMANGAASGEGWTFYGPAESASKNETSIKMSIRQSGPRKFDETVQWLKATSASDPGTWTTVLSGSCRFAT